MATKTLVTCEDYAALQEPEGMRYELSEGELIGTPSASYFHIEIRDYLNARLRAFVEGRRLGGVTSETDIKLVGETVRRPFGFSTPTRGWPTGTFRVSLNPKCAAPPPGRRLKSLSYCPDARCHSSRFFAPPKPSNVTRNLEVRNLV